MTAPTGWAARFERQHLRYIIAVILLATFIWRLIRVAEHFTWPDAVVLIPLLAGAIALALDSDVLDRISTTLGKLLDVVLDHVPGFHKEGT